MNNTSVAFDMILVEQFKINLIQLSQDNQMLGILWIYLLTTKKYV